MHPDIARHHRRTRRVEARRRRSEHGGLGDVIPEALAHPLDTMRAKYAEFKSKGPMYSRLRHQATVGIGLARSSGNNEAFTKFTNAYAEIDAAYNKWLDTNEKVDSLVSQVRSYGIDPGLGVVPAIILTAIIATAVAVAAAMAARIVEANEMQRTLDAIATGTLTAEQAAALRNSGGGGATGSLDGLVKVAGLGIIAFLAVKLVPSLRAK